MSYLMFWPTLRTDGSSSSGFSLAIAFLSGIWPGSRSPASLAAAVAGKVERALRLAAGLAMAERQVGRAPLGRVDVAPRPFEQGERHADQAGVVGVERVGLAVEGDRAGARGLGDPFVERLLVRDQLVVGGGEGLVRLGARRRRGLGLRRGQGAAWPAGAAGATAAVASPSSPVKRASRLLKPCCSSHGSSTLGSGFFLSKASGSAGVGTSSRSVHQLARDARQLGILLQRLAPLGLLDLAGARQQRLEVAVLVDELGRGLDADARHARHVVGRIAGQRLDVDDLVGRDAELLHHRLGPDLASS